MSKKPLTQINLARDVAHKEEQKELPRETIVEKATGKPNDMISGFKYGFKKHFYQPLLGYEDIQIDTGDKYVHQTRVGAIESAEPHVYSRTYQLSKYMGKPIGFILGKLCLGIPFQINKEDLLK